MKDKNGVEIRIGDVVIIEGAYFMRNNGYWFVENAPGSPMWRGEDCSLRKLNKSGMLSVTEQIAFWPLTHFCSDSRKNAAARQHDRKNATIEIVHTVPTYAISEHFHARAEKMRESEQFYRDKNMDKEVERYREAAAAYDAVSQRLKGVKPKEKPARKGLRFYYNGIKVDDGRLIPCNFYDNDNAIIITVRGYGQRLPNRFFAVVNKSSAYDDCFDTDRAIISLDNPLYKYAQFAAYQYTLRDYRQCIDHLNKRIKIVPAHQRGYYEKDIKIYEEKLRKLGPVENPGQPTDQTLDALMAYREAERRREQAEKEAVIQARHEAIMRAMEEGKTFIKGAMKQHPLVDGDPVVTVEWSENPALSAWQEGELKLSMAAADMILKYLDSPETRGSGGYDKTGLTIAYIDPWSGERVEISGRYDLGDMHYNGLERWIQSHSKNDQQIAWLSWILRKSMNQPLMSIPDPSSHEDLEA